MNAAIPDETKPANESSLALPLFLSTDALARELGCSPTPIANAIAAGRIRPDALTLRGALAGPAPMFNFNRLAEIRAALGR